MGDRIFFGDLQYSWNLIRLSKKFAEGVVKSQPKDMVDDEILWAWLEVEVKPQMKKNVLRNEEWLEDLPNVGGIGLMIVA